MSLMDALLLDPFPLDVWGTPRTDGVLGSGTEDDPFDGTRVGPPSIPITGPSYTNYYSLVGVAIGYISALSPALVPQLLARRNIIRHVDGIPDPPLTPAVNQSTGVSVDGCGALIVEENVVDLNVTNPLAFSWCGSAEFFANQTSGGSLVQGYNSVTSTSMPELPTNIDDAAALAF